jgi:hypothetical protein
MLSSFSLFCSILNINHINKFSSILKMKASISCIFWCNTPFLWRFAIQKSWQGLTSDDHSESLMIFKCVCFVRGPRELVFTQIISYNNSENIRVYPPWVEYCWVNTKKYTKLMLSFSIWKKTCLYGWCLGWNKID